MAFHFPLETVLNLRRSQERLEQNRLAALNRQFMDLARQLEVLELEKVAARERLRKELGEGLSGAEIGFHTLWEEAWKQRQVLLTRRMAELEQRRRVQREVLDRARQGREILENLSSRQRLLALQTQARREQQQSDELFLLSRYVKREG